MKAQDVWNYARLDDIANLEKAIAAGVPVLSLTYPGDSPFPSVFHAAVAHGSLNCARRLLRECPSLISVQSPNGFTAVHWAAYGGWLHLLQLLAQNKADMKALSKTRQTPLHIASARGHTNCIGWLTGYSDINAQEEFGWTPLHFAVAYGHKDVAALLIMKKAKTDVLDNLQRSVAVLASEYRRTWWAEVAATKK